MKIQLKITTPNGLAQETAKKIKGFLLGFTKTKTETIEANDSIIIWTIEADTRRIIQIQNNVLMYDKLITSAMKNPLVLKAARLPEEEKKKLNDFLVNQTRIEIKYL
jgi:hypothetical protein